MVLIITAAVAVLLAAGFISTQEIFFKGTFGRGENVPLDTLDLSQTYYAPYEDNLIGAMHEMREREHKQLSIAAKDGTHLLADYYDSGSRKTVLMIHGYMAVPLNNFAVSGRDFLNEGFNVLMPYHRGHGKSGGKYFTYGMLESDDMVCWLDELEKKFAPEDIIIYGLSMGCHTAVLTMEKLHTNKVRAAILDCGFRNIYEMLKKAYKLRHMPRIFLEMSRIELKMRFGVNIKEKDTADILRKTKIPVFFIHGKADQTVPFSDGLANYRACSSDKEAYFPEDVPHATGYLSGGTELKNRIYEFIGRYLTA